MCHTIDRYAVCEYLTRDWKGLSSLLKAIPDQGWENRQDDPLGGKKEKGAIGRTLFTTLAHLLANWVFSDRRLSYTYGDTIDNSLMKTIILLL
jgi:hypothetical protein